jgi:predicted ArsR family transcriptional regulator
MQATRQRIVELLKDCGQATVEELAKAVGLTQMAVRHHLNVLQGENLVATPSVLRNHRPGRPQQLYSLTEAADELFPENYYHLTAYLLDEVKVSRGPSGLNELLYRIANRLAAEAPLPRPGQSQKERLDQLVQLLGDKGFIARWETGSDGYAIHVLACPYRQAARAHNEVCGLDKQIIKNMLNAEPLRVACMASGDERCTYHIRYTVYGR